ncbi:MAG TPA: hypothetical protein DDZ51_04015, partial [Planctomycetaceae bacterium]|nr:hypothetical protein [Planctomycetaceae bacterium]
MAKTFDLRKQLKLHDKQLLAKLFDRCGLSLAIPWDQLTPGEFAPITSAWESLGESKRQVQLALQEIGELADSRGLRLLIDEMQQRYPDRMAELRDQLSLADKSLWAYLECPEAFEQA